MNKLRIRLPISVGGLHRSFDHFKGDSICKFGIFLKGQIKVKYCITEITEKKYSPVVL